MEYRTEVCVREIAVPRLLEEYYSPAAFHACCLGCPDYNKRWSCPPGAPDTREFFAPFSRAYLIGVKVIYTGACRRASEQPTLLEPIRQRTYGQVKKILHEVQLQLEGRIPGATSIAAGRCEQCARCTRSQGKLCMKPHRMRYSFSAFCFDLGSIADKELHMPLRWSANGLPEYNVAIAALLVP
ncbi:MAG: hypothetical protein J6L72_02520 [Butyricicoccus sp.]|nr:hypothetical protein [Butyricicoccus sp.]